MYSERIASAVGWVYWGSYMFYMISTSTYASSVLLPLFGVSGLYARLAEIILPSLIILMMISGIRPPLYYSLVTSMIEIIIIYVLGISVLRETGVSLSPFLPQEISRNW
nr:hypothetical protein [Metallosphaera hakonensis]